MMEALETLRENIGQLLERYEQLRQENVHLHEEVERQRQEIMRTHNEYVQLEKQYRQENVAAAIAGADEEKRQQAKQQLTGLINKIDRAMELLKQG
ncbi:MAG: hypothetical protein IJ609_00760 [Paludibacteraceae bacterium]|nr:hypothetical protein [Paludibacteraceae bacterium]